MTLSKTGSTPGTRTPDAGRGTPATPVGKDRRRRRGTRGLRGELAVGLLFLVPAAAILAVFRLWPALSAMLSSVGGLSAPTLDNYRFVLESDVVRQSIVRTVFFTAVLTPLQVVVALALATFLSQRLHGRTAVRLVVFLPSTIPQAISIIVWGVMMRPDGVLNAFLAALGLPTQPFLESSGQALWSIIGIATWAGVGYWMIFLIAGLNEIPDDMYEAARIDGAGWWRTFFSIVVPLLRRPLAFVLVADTAANFRLFAPVQILTSGGPEGSTNFLAYEIYQEAYTYNDYALASALVVLLVLMLLVIVAVQFRLLRPRH